MDSHSLLVDVDQYVTERQGHRLDRSSDLGALLCLSLIYYEVCLSSIIFSHLFCLIGNRSDHGGLPTDLGRTIRKTSRSEERPLTFSKAKGGLVPKVLEAEVEVEKQQEGVGQGEQGKLLLEVRLALINQS